MTRGMFAFDFDGVICDSAVESAHAAWRAARTLWPQRFGKNIHPEFVARFERCRPVIETGFQNLPLADLLERGVAEEIILRDFEPLCAEIMRDRGFDRDALQTLVGEARDEWIAAEQEGWLSAHGFYPGVVDAINDLSADETIVTTKPHRFTTLLAERARLDVPEERIFALESLPGGSKRNVLCRLLREAPERELHFFEDRLATLTGLTDLERTRLYLVDWGYNTEAERSAAASHPDIELIGLGGFTRLLDGLRGR